MGLLYKRNIRVSFGRKEFPSSTEINFTIVNDLFVSFDIEKTSEKTPNKARIQIHNLNQTSRSTLQQRDVFVRLDVGYAGQFDEIFSGNMFKGKSERTANEWITTLETGDGQEAFKSQVNTSLGPGTTSQQVVDTLAAALGAGIGAIKGLATDIFQNGIVLTGDVEARMDEIMDKQGLEWSIQDGKLQILPPDEPSEELGILISPNTGLIGAPIEREETDAAGKFIEFASLLRPQLKPGVAIQIASRDVNGIFKIRKANMTGDNKLGEFESRCEAKEIPTGALSSSQTLNISTVA